MMASGSRTFLSRHPEMRYWLDLGMRPPTAMKLVTAGYLTVADLAGKSREEVLALPGFGKGALARVEKHLGSPFPSRKSELEERGITGRVAAALGRAGIHSLAQLGRMTREQFLNTEGLTAVGLRKCERALGHELPSPLVDFRRQGLWPPSAYKLSLAGVRTVEELADRRDSELRAMGLREEDIKLCRKLIREGKG